MKGKGWMTETRASKIEKAARKIRGGPEGCLTQPNCGACAWCDLDRALALPPDTVGRYRRGMKRLVGNARCNECLTHKPALTCFDCDPDGSCGWMVCDECLQGALLTVDPPMNYLRRVVMLARAEPDLPTESVIFQAGRPEREIGPPVKPNESKTTIHVPEHLYEWAKGVAFLGLTRGFVMAREGAECPPPPDGDEVNLVLDAAGPAPVPEVTEGAARAEALRDAADMVDKNLWLEIVGAIRALANKAEKSASRRRDRALVRAGIVDILQPTDGRPVEVAVSLLDRLIDSVDQEDGS